MTVVAPPRLQPATAAARLRAALAPELRALYRAAFEHEAGVRTHGHDALQALTQRVVRLLVLGMVAGDFAGRAEAQRLAPAVVARWQQRRRRSGLAAQRAAFSGDDEQDALAPSFALLPFDEAVAYLASLRPAAGKDASGVVPDVAATYRAMEFRLRPQLAQQVAETVQAQLVSLMREGATTRDFVLWARQLGNGYVSDAYAETVWRTEVTRAQTAGRIRQVFDDPDLRDWVVAWRYHAVGDADTRPNHAAMSQRMYAVRHAAWRTMTPPCGWNCRCRLVAVTRVEAQGLGRWRVAPGGKVGDGEFVDDAWPVVGVYPDPGFGASPAQEIYGG